MSQEPFTESLTIPPSLIDQIIGQDKAVGIARIAARQRRFMFLVGEPGTGKSLIGRAFAELLPAPSEFVVSSVPNPLNPVRPLIRCESKEDFCKRQERLAQSQKAESLSNAYLIYFALVSGAFIALWLSFRDRTLAYLPFFLLAGLFLWQWRRYSKTKKMNQIAPKILHMVEDQSPFIDATGCSDGALFGDIRHDPFQSGGSETAPHLLVEAGAIHKAHRGVLFIDEIGQLSQRSQKLLLSAIQDKSLPITGRQSGSSGRMVCTEAVPCDFVLIASGNIDDLSKLSPALRSRFMGFGYEVLMKSEIPDTVDNREALLRFIAQEVLKDGRIPHFSRCAADEVIAEASRRAKREGYLTARLRELGGLVRIAGDLAVHAAKPLVSKEFVLEALRYTASIEEQQKQENQNTMS